jgi:hypothetical protein
MVKKLKLQERREVIPSGRIPPPSWPKKFHLAFQALPWGAGIVTLSCDIRECFATCCPRSSVSASLLRRSTNFFTATVFRRPPKSKKVGQLPSLRQFQFFDPTRTEVSAYFFAARASSNFVRTPAHELATLLLGSVAPGIVASPAFLTKSSRFQDSTFANSSHFASSAGPTNFSTHIGVYAATSATSTRSEAAFSAVPASVQPNP